MLVALHAGKRVLASADLARGPDYSCPHCDDAVRLHVGSVKTPHFSHLPRSSCSWAGESREHLEAKAAVLLSAGLPVLLGNAWDVQAEVAIGKRLAVADLVATNGGDSYSIEFQRSLILPDEIRRRTKVHEQHGFKVLWVLLGNPSFDSEDRLVLKDMQREIAELYGGRIAYYDGQSSMMVLEIVKAIRTIPEREYTDSSGYDCWVPEREVPYVARYLVRKKSYLRLPHGIPRFFQMCQSRL